MRAQWTRAFRARYQRAPSRVQSDFDKQVAHLLHDLRYPSLRAKKYDESRGIWQARVNRDWRFYFQIDGDTYVLLSIIPHPK